MQAKADFSAADADGASAQRIQANGRHSHAMPACTPCRRAPIMHMMGMSRRNKQWLLVAATEEGECNDLLAHASVVAHGQ